MKVKSVAFVGSEALPPKLGCSRGRDRLGSHYSASPESGGLGAQDSAFSNLAPGDTLIRGAPAVQEGPKQKPGHVRAEGGQEP